MQTAAHHPLDEALDSMLPSAGETRLLRGCLDEEQSGRRALSLWLEGQPDPIAALTSPSLKWLLPLVQRACARHGVCVPAAAATVLKAAALRAQLRAPSYQAIRGRILRALADARVPAMALKGTALGDLVYPDPSLRHTHDLELWIPAEHWNRAAEALAPLRLSGLAAIAHAARAELVHPSGLPVVLQRHLFPIPFYNAASDAPWSRAEAVELAGEPARVLAPADMLMHVCGRAVHSPSRDSYRWIVDAWYLLHRRPDLDWDVFLETAASRRLTLPLSRTLHYLMGALDAPVPVHVLDRLAAGAAKDRSIGVEAALYGARVAAGGLRPLLRRARSARSRVAIVRHTLLPSATFLAWMTRPRSPLLRTTHGQLFRAVRYFARRCRG